MSKIRFQKIEIVLPDQYHGVFKINFDSEGEALQPNNRSVYKIAVPRNGILTLQNADIFNEWHKIAISYQNGEKISNAGFYELDNNSVGLYLLWSDSDGCIYFLIGTQKEYQIIQELGPWEVEKFIPSIKEE